MNIRCIRHPKYLGVKSPILSCNTCCKIFVDLMSKEVKSISPEETLKNKQKQFLSKKEETI